MINITPTLIIGVGSSGLEIMNSARELMYEEFLSAGMPSVRFINISSHKNGETFRLPNNQFSNIYEKVKVIEISIPDTLYKQVPMMLDPSRKDFFRPGLAEWFLPELAKLGNTDLQSGMQNKRMLGRLALWLNWDNVTKSIQEEINVLHNNENKDSTQAKIKEYLKQKGINQESANYVNNNINVYLVGTLHGGTCSGTMLDLAYFIRTQNPLVKVFGIFTFMDDTETSKPNNSRLSANAYAGMVENDFYRQTGTVFNYFFPNSMNSLNEINPPFEHVHYISTKNKKGTSAAIVRTDGSVDFESLHKMIGISMFFDTVGGQYMNTGGLRCNWTFLKKQVETRPRYLKSFSSFGAVALWFPKSRISGAAAAKFISNKLCTNWLGNQSTTNNQQVQNMANQIVSQLTQEITSEIVGFINESGVQTTIGSDWRAYVNQKITDLEINNPNVAFLKSELIQTPTEDPYVSRFKIQGYYYKQLSLNINRGTNIFKLKLKDTFERQIKIILSSINIDGGPNNISLADLVNLQNLVKNQLTELSRKAPNLSTKDIDFSLLDPNFDAVEVEQNRITTTMVFLRDEVLKQHYKRISDGINFIFNEAEENLIKNFISQIIKNNLDSLDSILNKIINENHKRVIKIKDLANQRFNDLSQVHEYTSLKIISQSGLLENDIEKYSSEIDVTQFSTELPDLIKNILDPQQTEEYCFDNLAGSLQTNILRNSSINNFDVASRVDRTTLINFARNAEPMFEPDLNYQQVPYPVGQNPTIIGGGSQNSREQAKTEINEYLPENKISIELPIDLNHLLYIYKEEAGIAISEFKAFNSMKAQYQIGHEYGNHIDKNPERFNIERFLVTNEMKTDSWFKVSKDLFEDIIYTSKNKDPRTNQIYYVFSYVDEFDENTEENFIESNEQDFIQKLVNNKYVFDHFREKFDGCFANMDKKGFKERMNNHLNEFLESGNFSKISPEYEKEKLFYTTLMNKKYSAD